MYGRILDTKLKNINSNIINSIAEQPDDVLLLALEAEKENEEDERNQSVDVPWHTREPINWNVMTEMQREQVIRNLEVKKADVLICKYCEKEIEFKYALFPCGCMGGCAECYEEAQQTTKKCPERHCRRAIASVMKLNGDCLTKTREQLEVDQLSQDYNDLRANHVAGHDSDYENQRNEAEDSKNIYLHN